MLLKRKTVPVASPPAHISSIRFLNTQRAVITSQLHQKQTKRHKIFCFVTAVVFSARTYLNRHWANSIWCPFLITSIAELPARNLRYSLLKSLLSLDKEIESMTTDCKADALSSKSSRVQTSFGVTNYQVQCFSTKNMATKQRSSRRVSFQKHN